MRIYAHIIFVLTGLTAPVPIFSDVVSQDLRYDMNNDRIVDSIKIMNGRGFDLKGYVRAVPPRGYNANESTERELVIIEISNGKKFYLSFPFVENLILSSRLRRGSNLHTCMRGSEKGFFAVSEEGAIFIYYRRRSIYFRPCFE